MKKIIHCDIQGTLLDTVGPSKNSDLIINFMMAAIRNGHTARTVSTIGVVNDLVLEMEFDGRTDPFMPTMKKRINGIYLQCDLLIDDDPIIKPGTAEFNRIAKTWINPNSNTLPKDLESTAHRELGFQYKPH